ncbi:MAG: histidinol-phosphate transaminase [Lachnospiraceae bacterium]|nr:histidinol-phosphate transaminase [Lachnospiraceae bacterium]
MSWEANIRKADPYTPGEQPGIDGIIKLNTNENPYPPPPQVLAAIAGIRPEEYSLYPDPDAGVLRQSLASYHGVEKEQVFVGVGSDDVLALAFLTFFNSPQPILFPDITYSFYDVWANLYRIPFVTKPLRDDFTIDPADYMGNNGGIIFPNPNAPTGLLLEPGAVEEILRANPDAVVIVDEAYIDFCPTGKSVLPLIGDYENLLVVRTFSKSRSLAGLRIGYALGSKRLIGCLQNVKFSFNSYTMDLPSLRGGVASIHEDAYFRETLEKVIVTREWTKKELEKLGFVCTDSQSNFLFAHHAHIPAVELFAMLKEAGIYVRYFAKPRIEQYLRITVGTQAQMEALVDCLRSLVKQ